MKNTIFSILLLAYAFIAHAQLNMELVSRLPYNSETNDVWGYTAPDGTEYVLVGLFDGVSIVSLADPSDPQELFFIPGEGSTWRDLRTWQHYAYVTTDQPGTKEGLLVIDMAGLPDDITYQKLNPVYPGETDSLFTCHNVWVDEKGFAYLAGCNTSTSNVVFLNLNNDPYNPEFAGFGADVISHDTYARNDLFYSAEIFDGQFGVYDVSDKANPVVLASQKTPFEFCHNVWLSDDGNTIFTTDEKANAPTAAYDISDLNDIQLLDEFRPAATLGTGVIPHNVHVINDFLVISHYTDGCIIVDANQPDNLVETGHFDTSTSFTEGFHGAWGAYPFFPSGLIAVTDIENGLFILNPQYERASYLEGQITDKATGVPVSNAEIVIQSNIPNTERSDLFGMYKTGLSSPGTYEVQVVAKGYFDKIVTATLSQGDITLLNVELTPLPPYPVSGTISDHLTGQPVAGASVLIENDDFQYTTGTDAEGTFFLPAVLQGNYNFYFGKWGYLNESRTLELQSDENLRFELIPGYDDPFNLDLGWQVSGDATSGIWERGVPKGTKFAGKDEIFNPFNDSPADPGPRAFVTGNTGIGVFDDEVQNGATILTSPPMQLLRRYNRPQLSYDAYFYNVFSNNFPNDTLSVLISNGVTTVELEHLEFETRTQEWRPSPVFDLVEWIEITDEMRLIVQVTDRTETPNVVEGGFDHFQVSEGLPDDRFGVKEDIIRFSVHPNPFVTEFTVNYKVEKDFSALQMIVTNVLGSVVDEQPLAERIGRLSLQPDYVAGVYFVSFRVDGKLSKAIKVVKGY